MSAEKWSTDDFPYVLIENMLGEINEIEQEIPGVYYLSVSGGEEWSRGEYYAVLEQTPNISQEAKEYGVLMEDDSELLLYPFEKDNSGWRIIQYEVYRYCTANGLPLPEKDALINSVLYGREIHPDYFGTYPVPTLTPWGYTLRYKVLDNGIYWMETSYCRRALAVCSPICQGLSDIAMKIAVQTEHNPETEMEGPAFFEEKSYCIPIWELMKTRKRWQSGMVDKAALMNAIWQNCPEYAAVHNAQVQQGLYDTTGLLLNSVGIETELNPDMEDAISISPQAGIEFLCF